MRKFTDKSLVIATHNDGKAQEIAALLQKYVHDFHSAKSLNLDEPEETGATFIANAELKALAAAKAAGMPALADDSGLAVHALGGDPGIYSARWAQRGDGSRDFSYAMDKIIDLLADKADKTASFICVLSMAWPDGHVESFEGRVDGVITHSPRGEMGFGYDPIFVPDGYAQTFAEMEPEFKHKISHRADAFQKLVAGCFNQ